MWLLENLKLHSWIHYIPIYWTTLIKISFSGQVPFIMFQTTSILYSQVLLCQRLYTYFFLFINPVNIFLVHAVCQPSLLGIGAIARYNKINKIPTYISLHYSKGRQDISKRINTMWNINNELKQSD